MKARDVMTHCVVSITPEASIAQAIARMISHGVSGMPVIGGDGALVGIVTESDFLRRVETDTDAIPRRWVELLLGAGSGAEDYARTHGRLVRDVMSQAVFTTGPDSLLSDVVAMMEENAIKRVPVVDDGHVVGIVSRSDLMTAVADRLNEPKAHASSDQAIRGRIVSELKRQTWAPLHSVKVAVRDGVVELQGTIYDERQRRALEVLVRNIDGVKNVRDKMRCIEPITGTVTHATGAP